MLCCHGPQQYDCASPWNNFSFLSKVLYYNNELGSLLADLSKHKRYEIRLSVYNAVGEGPSSAPQEVFVGEAGMFFSHTV